MVDLTRRALAQSAILGIAAVAAPATAGGTGRMAMEKTSRDSLHVNERGALNDEAQIRRIIVLYGQLLDDRRFEEWADLFRDEAIVMGYAGRQAFLKGIAGSQPPTPTKHVACSTIIDLDGDRANAWTDAFGWVDAGPGPNGSRSYANFPLRYYDQDIDVTFGVESEAVRSSDHRLRRLASPIHAVGGKQSPILEPSFRLAAAALDPPDDAKLVVRDVDVAVGVERDLVQMAAGIGDGGLKRFRAIRSYAPDAMRCSAGSVASDKRDNLPRDHSDVNVSLSIDR